LSACEEAECGEDCEDLESLKDAPCFGELFGGDDEDGGDGDAEADF